MGYLGREIQYGSFAKQTLTADSSTTVFTLSNGVADANNLLVSIGGIIQEPNVAYTAIGTVLTFASAPVTNDPIFITYLGMETTTAASARDDVTYQIGTGNGTTTPITLSMSVVNSDAIRVSLNGVVQKPWTDFTASGTTLTFSTAPDATNEILVYYIGKEDSISDVATGSVTAAKLSSTGTLPAWNGTNITGINILPYSKFNDLKTSLSLMGFRRSQHHGTSNLDLPNGFIDQFEDETNVDTDASVNETYAAGVESATVTTGQAPGNFGTSNANLPSGTGTNAAMRFQTSTTDPITAISVGLHNQNNRDVTIQIVTGSATVPDVDTLVATGATSTILAANLVINTYNKFTLDKPFTPVVGTNYWIQMTAGSGSGDTRLQEGNASQYTWAYAGLWTTTSGHNSNSLIPVEVHQTPAAEYYAPTVATYLPMTRFDGSTTWLNIAEGTLGATDGKSFTICFYIRMLADSTTARILSTTNGRFNINLSTNNAIYFLMRDSSNNTALNGNSAASLKVADGLTHVAISIDAANSTGHIRLNNDPAIALSVTNRTIDITQADFVIGDTTGGGGVKINADIGRFYLTQEYIDISNNTNLAKFIDADNNPVDMGATGSTPSGSQPLIFLNNEFGTFQTNAGSGGNFTENGTLTQGTNLTITSNSMTLISESETAATAPEKAYVTLFNEPVDSLTLNTDIMAWVSRSNKTITATNASNVLNATAHGLSNGDRVILSSTWIDAVPAANQCSAMTSATAPSGTVSSDQTGGFGYHNWHAFKQPADQAKYYSNQGNSGNAFLQYSFNNGLTAKVIVKYSITNVSSFGTSSSPKDFALKASNTGAFSGEEVTLDTQTNQTYTAGGTNTYSFSNSTSYVHYRLAIVNIAHSGGEVGIANMELWSAAVDGYSTLPAGLSETAYHVVNKTANTFQVAATNGGAAVTFTDDGTGTHSAYNVTSVTLADKGDYGTGKAILAGTADITGQPTGTDVRLIVQTKNSKETNLHGMAVQYGKKDS